MIKITIDFGEGAVRDYTVSGSVEQDIRAGKDLLLHTCHPEFGEGARVRPASFGYRDLLAMIELMDKMEVMDNAFGAVGNVMWSLSRPKLSTAP